MRIKILVIGIIIAVFSGCSSKVPSSGISNNNGECIVDGHEAPSWICTPEETIGHYTNYGTSIVNDAGFDFARTDATASAKASLALQVKSKIEVLVKRFTQTTGAGKSAIDSVKVQNTNQLADVTIAGAKQLGFWESPKNRELYVLVGVRKDMVFDNLSSSVGGSHNDKALWQQFLAKQSDEEMASKITAATE